MPLLAKALVATGQGDKIATETANRRPRSPRVGLPSLTMQGTNLIGRARSTRARRPSIRPLRESANYPLARVGLARLRRSARDFDGALVDVDAVLKDAPTLPEAHSPAR